ncbi:MAG: DUF3307 domain-containing protein [Roseburia sp.]|nr:DUF3307 domain-containing protein [Roseburia sp.]
MLFCHVIDDYFLQGILASMKQKSWWKENAPDKLYSFDYLMALAMHAFSWSFMIQLPIAIALNFQVPQSFVFGIISNTIVHAVIDDLKANRHKINLIEDQSLHIIQIAITFMNLKQFLV